MEKQFSCTQFRECLIASIFATIGQLHAIKWRMRKQALCTIPRNRIPIGNLNSNMFEFHLPEWIKNDFTNSSVSMPLYSQSFILITKSQEFFIKFHTFFVINNVTDYWQDMHSVEILNIAVLYTSIMLFCTPPLCCFVHLHYVVLLDTPFSVYVNLFESSKAWLPRCETLN